MTSGSTCRVALTIQPRACIRRTVTTTSAVSLVPEPLRSKTNPPLGEGRVFPLQIRRIVEGDMTSLIVGEKGTFEILVGSCSKSLFPSSSSTTEGSSAGSARGRARLPHYRSSAGPRITNAFYRLW